MMVYGILSSLPMLVCAFWTVTLLAGFRRGDRAKRMLALFMGVAAALYFCHWVYFNRAAAMMPATDTLYALCTLSVYPLISIYIRLLTDSRRPAMSGVWVFVPALVSCAACGTIYAMMSGGERMEYVEGVMFGGADADTASPLAVAQSVRARLAGAVLAVQIALALWSGGRRINRYNREIADYYSHTEGKTLTGVRVVLMLFVATSVASFVMNIVGRDHFAGSAAMILIPSLLFSTLLYTVGYIGLDNRFTAVDFAHDVEADETPHDSAACADVGEDRQADNNITAAVLELIASRELYRQPDIKISDVARLMNTNRTYISAALNRDTGLSFAAMMNRHRVKYAERLIADSGEGKSEYTMAEIIEMSGFSSRSSFHRVFKEVTGTTPKKLFADARLH